jgi:hypothetical protein
MKGCCVLQLLRRGRASAGRNGDRDASARCRRRRRKDVCTSVDCFKLRLAAWAAPMMRAKPPIASLLVCAFVGPSAREAP